MSLSADFLAQEMNNIDLGTKQEKSNENGPICYLGNNHGHIARNFPTNSQNFRGIFQRKRGNYRGTFRPINGQNFYDNLNYNPNNMRNNNNNNQVESFYNTRSFNRGGKNHYRDNFNNGGRSFRSYYARNFLKIS